MVHKIVVLFVLMLALTVVGGCASPPAIPREPASYAWSEPGPRLESNVTVAIVMPELTPRTVNALPRNSIDHVASDGSKINYPFGRATVEALQAGLQSGLHGMFVGKGINPRGMYQNTTEMTYPEKRGTDMIVFPLLDLEATAQRTNVEAGFSSITQYWTVSWSGEINVRMIEPMSGELFWQKRFPFQQMQDSITIVTAGGKAGNQSADNAIENSLSRLVKQAYDEVMAQMSRHISAEELTALKQLSDECKAKTVHTAR